MSNSIPRNTKHTPGPWNVEGFIVDHLTNGECDFQATVDGCGTGDNPTSEDIARMKVNARLIASAPDMLDALYEVLNVLADGAEVKQVVLKAIRKAEGK